MSEWTNESSRLSFIISHTNMWACVTIYYLWIFKCIFIFCGTKCDKLALRDFSFLVLMQNFQHCLMKSILLFWWFIFPYKNYCWLFFWNFVKSRKIKESAIDTNQQRFRLLLGLKRKCCICICLIRNKHNNKKI